VRAASSLLVVALTGIAAADPAAVAEQQFARGRALMKEHKYAEACAAFEQSQRLDPQLGTLFNVADCDVEIGKLASAWKIYRELAKSDPNADRRAISSDLAKKLEKRLPKLLVTVPARPPGLAVSIDGVDSTALLGVETPVDAGDHTIVATATGFRDRREAITAREGKIAKLQLALEPKDAETPPPPPAPTPTPAPAPVVEPTPAVTATIRAPNPRDLYGKVLMAGGGAVTAAGLVIGVVAISKYHDAESCTGCDKLAQSHNAVILGDVSTVIVVVGLAATGTGVYLWRSASSSAVIAPSAGTDHASVSIMGRF
jgi:tetratricopeptide (TPR) repeat protein